MDIQIDAKIAEVKKRKGAVKAYRAAPGDFEAAVYAALHYAIRDNRDMYLIPGNSYGHFIWHISELKEDFTEFTVYKSTFVGAKVTPGGRVFRICVVQ